MPQVIKILNGGFSNINGHPVGVIIFRVSTNESKPEDHLAYCPAKQNVEVIKSLRKLHCRLRESEIFDVRQYRV